MRRNNRNDFSDELLDGEYEVSYNGKLAPSKKSRKSIFRFTDYDIGTWMYEHRLPFFINLNNKAKIRKHNNLIHIVYYIIHQRHQHQEVGFIIRIPENDDIAVKNVCYMCKDFTFTFTCHIFYIIFS